ncbi:two-component sensor histidine kinase BarA [Shewanella sp. YIC-542]|uniref:two-component sensor histidine kinase BarA n=1 Tax=Shewanella mytili TaxID=3377111 RepID=UPI00398F5F58
MKSSNYMSKHSLRSWVLVLALAPTILVGILLGAYFTINRFYELEDTLREQGSNIIEPIAIAGEASLLSNNREAAKRLLAAAQLNKSSLVQSIAIFDANNQLFVTSHYHKDFELMRFPREIAKLTHTQYEQIGDSLIVRTPIYATGALLTLDDVPGITQKADRPIGYVTMLLNKERALLEQHRAAFAAFIIVLIGVQLNLLFTFRLVKNVTQPITEMVQVVAKIREGKLDTRVNGNLIGELDLLKRGINAMAGSLSEYHDEMQQNIDQATSDLRETLEQIEIQNVELDMAKKRAQEASRIKSEFLANMSHELRTPLNGVIGFARQLLKTPLHDSQLDYIRTIERSASNLLSIINDILDFSKLDAGKMVLENMPFSLRENLDEAVKLLSSQAREKRLELVVEVMPAVPDAVSGDAMRVSQIINNLVGNAIKFTDKGSVLLKVDVNGLQEDQVELHCEVSDTGIGIKEEQQALLFQAFGQADTSISRRFGGTGLGLIITKRLINQMGGQIGLTSRPGKGSTFWFTLPLKKSPYPLADHLPLHQLSSKTTLVFEPRPLSAAILQRRLLHWQMKVDIINDLPSLLTRLAEGPSYDFLLFSCISFTDTDTLSDAITTARKYAKRLMALSDSHDQQLLNSVIRPNADLVLTPPVGESAMARHMLALLISPTESLLPLAPAPARATLPMTVLAVDDNPANLKLIQTLLQELVSHVQTAASGAQAIELAKASHFDLIFMDIQMPETDGFTATAAIRQDSMNGKTPIIAVTAHAINEERKRILNSGMDGYLPKPIDEVALKAILNRWSHNPAQENGNDQTLNWPLCLMQANNKVSLAQEMLQMLLDSIPQNRQEIEAALSKEQTDQLLSLVHKLHGACCYSGVPTLQQLCQTLESALKQGESLQAMEPEILELLDELTKVESAAQKLLSSFVTD